MTKKYVLHPGLVVSKNDGDRHIISAPKLAQLYGVKMDECMIFDKRIRYTYSSSLIHLFPSYSGDYELPND